MTKLEAAIKACRNLAERGNPGAWGAIADALESLSSPPPSDTVEGAGEASEIERIHRAIGERGPHDRMADCVIDWIVDAKEGIRERDDEIEELKRRAEAAEAQRDALIDANGGADGYESALRWPMLQREKIARLESDRDAARARVAEVTRSRFLAQQAAVELLGAIEGADIAVEPGPRARRLQEAADKVRLFERPPGKPCPSRWCSKPLGHDDECDFALEEPPPPPRLRRSWKNASCRARTCTDTTASSPASKPSPRPSRPTRTTRPWSMR